RFLDAFQAGDVLARARRPGEVELDRAATARRLDLLDLVELLDARLYLRRLRRLCLEALDEAHLLAQHRLLALVLRRLLALGEGALLLVEIVVAGIGGELAAVDLDHLGDDSVRELAVVRRHHERALVARKPTFEP